MKKFTDFYNAWHFILNHPCFEDNFGQSLLYRNLDIEVVKVNPETETIEDDVSKNTATRVWLEFGPMSLEGDLGMVCTHDPDLDCGGNTFEEAIIELANLILDKYGEYENDY